MKTQNGVKMTIGFILVAAQLGVTGTYLIWALRQI
jgi:hypothetical protein